MAFNCQGINENLQTQVKHTQSTMSESCKETGKTDRYKVQTISQGSAKKRSRTEAGGGNS